MLKQKFKNSFISIILLVAIENIFYSYASAQLLILTGSASEIYDDNTNSSAENPEKDYITNLMLGAGINLEGRTQTLQLLGHTYQQLYYKQKELNNNSQDAMLNYRKEFTSRDRFTLNNTFRHQPEAREFQDMFGQPEGRNGYYTNSLNVTFTKDLINDFSIDLHYLNVITRGTSNTVNDSLSNGVGLRLNYGINAFNIIFVFYDYNITKYKSQEENIEYNNIQHTGGGGYQHYFTKQLYGTFAVGIDYIESRDDTQKSPYLNLSLIDDIDARNTINISITRSYRTTLLTDEVYKSWILSVLFTRQVSDRFAFALSSFYQYGHTINTQSNQVSRLLGATISGNYYLNENLFVSALYTYTYYNNKQTRPITSESEYDRNQIEISATARN
jgi:hypothetical protein